MEAKKVKRISRLVNRSRQYSDIIKLIKNAANDGEYNIWYYREAISEKARLLLRTHGYVVCDPLFYNDLILTEIKW